MTSTGERRGTTAPVPDLDAAMAAVRARMTQDRPDPWANSPYAWIRALSSRAKGKAGELAVEEWLTAAGIRVERAATSGWDRTIAGLPVEIKLSTLWETGQFRFQQLRDQGYSHVILFAVAPHALSLWCVPKAVALAQATGQHTGGAGTETKWLSFDADHVPAWLAPYGGTPAQGLAALAAAVG